MAAKLKHISRIIEIGPNTSRLILTESTSIYLITALANSLMENELVTSVNQENCLYQLWQIGPKFYCLSTYTLCRSLSKTAPDSIFHPYTIWKLYKYDLRQKTDSRA